MKTLIKRSFLPGIAVTLVSLFSQVASAQDMSMTVTADNTINVYLSTDDAVLGSNVLGPGTDWTLTDTSTPNLAAGVVNYIHVVADNIGGPAMFLGEFTLLNNTFEFANGTTSLLTNTTDWSVSATDFTAPTYLAPSDLGPNDGTSVTWAGGYGHPDDLTTIDPTATFIWHPSGDGTTPAYFSAAIVLLLVDINITSTENRPDPVIAGSGLDNLNNTWTVTNTGPLDDASGLVVSFSAITTGGAIFSDPSCTYTPSAGSFSWPDWDIGPLANGAPVTITESCNITSASVAGANRDLTLSVSALDQVDPDPSDDSSSQDFTVAREAAITVIKTQLTLDPIVAGAGGVSNLCYIIHVDNAGPSNVTDLNILDTPEPYFGIVGVGISDFTFPLPAGTDVEIPVCFTVLSGAPVGLFTNTAIATGSGGGEDLGNPLNHTSSVVTPITREATFDVTKIWDGGEVAVQLTCGGVEVDSATTSGLAATLTVTDFADLTDCTVTETVPAGFAPGYSAECDVTGVLSGSVYSCDITNAETVARFQVTKDFSDGSTDDVEVTLTCNTGLPLEQSKTIAGGDDFGVVFVVTDYIDGTMSCSVTEATNTPGYDADATGCVWENVMTSDSPFSCVVNNTAQDATFTVYKVWEIISEGGEEVNTHVPVTIVCDSLITGSNGLIDDYDFFSATKILGDGDSLWVKVNTTTGPAWCSAFESITQSGVESIDDCDGRWLTAGDSDSCTFTNTVFFEGIPTLSQYGLALMALLMLGVGMVGFRRFA
jgi:hypothetical protein